MSIAAPLPPEPSRPDGVPSAADPAVAGRPGAPVASSGRPRRSLGRMAGVVLLLLAGLALLDLLLQNGHHAQFHFLWLHVDLSLSALVFAAAFVAIVLDEMVSVVWRRRRRRLLNLEEGTARPGRRRR